MSTSKKLRIFEEYDIKLFEKLGIFRKKPKITAYYHPLVKHLKKNTIGRMFLEALKDMQDLGLPVEFIETEQIEYNVPYHIVINNVIHFYGTPMEDLANAFILALAQDPWVATDSKKYVVFAGIYCPTCPVEIARVLDEARKKKMEVIIFDGEEATELAEIFGVTEYPTTFIVDSEIDPMFAEREEVSQEVREKYAKIIEELFVAR